MSPLDKELRNRLERTVKDARDIAEAAARAALEHLGVGESAPFGQLSQSERELRRRLRIHGRQLGDKRNPSTETQEIGLLVEEVAYEHWHRMLFARFLAENDLLMYPDPEKPVPVTLEECRELAEEEGARNGWELAAMFAARMLPQIFRHDSPVFQIDLPPEHQIRLERLLDGLSSEVFTASDALGWVYQFWQAKKKEEVNASEVKIGARELPAVTQLFTEPYMVSFLLDNSLGAWWAVRRLTPDDLKDASDEEELRRKASIPGVPLRYLRFVKEEGGPWRPAGGTFDAWPKSLAEFKTLDPCCGSGHFLVAAFSMLVPMRMVLEGLSTGEAVDAVLRDNLHGLELDKRCVEIAAFALALAAWRFPGAGGYRPLPKLNLACSGLAVSAAKEEWEQLGLNGHDLRLALLWMHEFFEQAPVLGSLLDPVKSDAAKLIKMKELSEKLERSLERALERERTEEIHEMGVVAHGLSEAARLLARKYHWIITNVPYLARGKQCSTLRDHCEVYFPVSKKDLATVFLERCLDFCHLSGNVSIVLPQNWLFLTTDRKLREKLLKYDTWHVIARLGPGAFETVTGEVVKAILFSISRGQASDESGAFSLSSSDSSHHLISGLDVSAPRTARGKAAHLLTDEIKQVEQDKQIDNPDARVAFSPSENKDLIGINAFTATGIQTFDRARFIELFWEIKSKSNEWEYCQSTVNETIFYGGCQYVLLWEKGKGQLFFQMESKKELEGYTSGIWKAGSRFWGRKGVLISLMGDLQVSLYLSRSYDQNVGLITPKNDQFLLALWEYCSSQEFTPMVRGIDQALKVTNATFGKIPIEREFWEKIADEKYPNGLPEPFSDDPTQWIFHGHPCGSVIWDEETKWTAHGPLRTDETIMQVAVARLLGYRWPAETDAAMELARQQREWVRRCEGLLRFADEDGIVCIPAVRRELHAADRLMNLLAAAYGSQWSSSKLDELLSVVGFAGRTLEDWLRDGFFTQHCKLFHHRPFIWHVWDGLRDGFAALVNYHRLDHKNLEALIYTYLGAWIRRQKEEITSGIDGALERLAAAEVLKKSLELILEGEAPYDIFVRWKPLERQPIGWNPDLNDGVRLNIRPFLTVPDVRKKGAGVLREKPNVHWKKDRGKDVESAPWYHLGPQYGGRKGDRINDHHLTLEVKRRSKAGFDNV